MRNKDRKRDMLLVLAAVLLLASVWGISAMGRAVPTPYYQQQYQAALRMQRCMDAIVGYKEERGIPLSEEDLHGTGLVGEAFNWITTTSGDLEAKRTTANSDMAALLVVLLNEAGVQPGDRVGASFSGSFPAMNLAVLCASAELEVEVVAVASVGSSTYGANTPELTFPEMLALLVRDGLLPDSVAQVTLGGGKDVGEGMDEAMVAEIESRLYANHGISLWKEPDFQKNLQQRMEWYEADGEISCYIGVGGNLISSGRDSAIFPYGVTLPGGRYPAITEKSGLMEVYREKGIPVIHILNIKQLVADYRLPLDPAVLPEPGMSAVYYTVTYPKGPAVLVLLAAAAVLALYRKWGKRP